MAGVLENSSTVMFYMNTSQPDLTPAVPLNIHVGKSLILCLIMVAGFTLNVAVIASIARHIKPKSVHLRLVIVLCAIDLITTLICLPVPLLSWWYPLNRNWICRLFSWISMTLYLEHNIMLLLVLLDRVLCTARPVIYLQALQKQKTLMLVNVGILVSWLCSALFNLGSFTQQIPVHFDAVRGFCIIDYYRRPDLKVATSVFLISVMASLIAGYTWLCMKLRTLKKVHNISIVVSVPPGAVAGNTIKSKLDYNGCIVSCLATMLYLAMWLPFWVVLQYKTNPPLTAVLITTLMLYASTCLNPLVYGVLNHRIRAGVMKLLRKQ